MREFKMYVGESFMEMLRVSLSGTEEEKRNMHEDAVRSSRRRKIEFQSDFEFLWGEDLWRVIDRVMTAKFGKEFWLCANHYPSNIWMIYWSANPDNDYDDSEIGIRFRDGKFVYEHVTPTGGYGDIHTMLRDDLTPPEVEEFCRVKPTPARFIFTT